MSHTFKLSTLALTGMLALAGAAQAEGVAISTVGKSRDAVRSDVVRAARAVCEQATASDLHDAYGSMDECVTATVRATLARISTGPDGLALARQVDLPR